MQKIKKFQEFVNEDYSFKGMLQKGKELVGKVFNWTKSLIDKISNAKPAAEAQPGDVKLIPSGPKTGLPMIGYFANGEGSIVDQIKAFYAGSSVANESEVYEDKDFLSMGGKFPDVNASELKEMIKERFQFLNMSGGDEESTGFSKPIFVFGAPGIGKTEIVGQAADELGIDLMKVDAEFMEPTDFLGVPTTHELPSDEENPYGEGYTRDNPPIWLPRDNNGKKYKDGRGGIIFFDEINRANAPVLNGFMKLAQARAINQYKLPTKWLIIAAGNREKDETDPSLITPVGTAFKRRFTIVNYLPTTKGLVDFIQTSGAKFSKALGKTPGEFVLPELVAYFESGHGEEMFHNLTPGSDRELYASPAGWIDASQSLYSKLKKLNSEGKKTISEAELERIFSTEVGPEAAAHFIKFYKMSQKYDMASIAKVFDEPDKAILPRKVGDYYKADEAHAFLAAVVSKSRELQLTPQQFSNAIDYAIRLDDTEYATSFMKNLMANHPYIAKSGPHMKFMTKFQDKYIKDVAEFMQKK